MKTMIRMGQSMRWNVLLLLLTASLAACCCNNNIQVSEAWVRKLPGNVPMAGYFTLTNHTNTAVILTAVESPDFAHTHMHQTVTENGQSKMKALADLMLEPDQSLSFEPGGRHIMLMKPKREIREGEEITLTLVFDDGSRLDVPFIVKSGSGE